MSALTRVRDAVATRRDARAYLAAVSATRAVPLVTLGDLRYGGYTIPEGLLSAQSTVVCVGAGTDVSFETLLVERFGCRVFLFDPVPEAAAHATQALASVPQVIFERLAIWDEDTELPFHAPVRDGFVSHSATDMHGTPVAFTAPARTLTTLAARHGWTDVDLVKISAEGAEFAILDNLLASGLHVRAITNEWAQPVALDKVRATIARLGAAGFEPIAVHAIARNHKISFVHQSFLR